MLKTRNSATGLMIVGLILFVIVVAALAPHLMIWAINELFDLSLPHDFMNWLAALVLGAFMGASKGSSRK